MCEWERPEGGGVGPTDTGGGWEQGLMGQSPMWEDDLVLGIDGGDAAQQCERAIALKALKMVNFMSRFTAVKNT